MPLNPTLNLRCSFHPLFLILGDHNFWLGKWFLIRDETKTLWKKKQSCRFRGWGRLSIVQSESGLLTFSGSFSVEGLWNPNVYLLCSFPMPFFIWAQFSDVGGLVWDVMCKLCDNGLAGFMLECGWQSSIVAWHLLLLWKRINPSFHVFFSVDDSTRKMVRLEGSMCPWKVPCFFLVSSLAGTWTVLFEGG